MKKLLLIIAIIFSLSMSAKDIKKSYCETNDPSPDSIMKSCILSVDGGSFVISSIDTINNLSSEQLFNRAKEFIGRYYKNPGSVIKSENKPTQIIVDGQLAGDLSGRMELLFKDGRMKFTITNIILNYNPIIVRTLGYNSKPAEIIPRYNNGERGKKWLMYDLYSFFKDLKVSMLENKENNW